MSSSTVSAVLRAPRRAALVVAAAAVAAGPAAARAHHGLIVDVCPPAVVVQTPPPPGSVWVGPVYRTVYDRQWVGPTCQTVTVPVWVPPTTAAVVPRRVYVPDEFGWRRVVGYDVHGRRYASRRWVLVVPAHDEEQCDSPPVVTPGHYEDVPQPVVSEGHWTRVERQELVAPGHWEPAECPPPPPRHEFRIRLPF